MNRLAMASALLAIVTACIPDSAGDDAPDTDDACPSGRFVATTVAFEASGCIAGVVREGPTFSVSAPGLSWTVSAFDDGAAAGAVLDGRNSSTTAVYEREGLEWVTFTGGIGGTPQGESSLTLTGVSESAWRGRIDGVAIPGTNNDSLESLYVTVVVE